MQSHLRILFGFASQYLFGLVYWYPVSWDIYIFQRSTLCQMRDCWKNFFPFCTRSFCSINGDFSLLKAFSIMWSHLISASLNICSTDVLFKTMYSLPMCSRLFPIFSSMITIIYDFNIFNPLGMSFVWGDNMDLLAFPYMQIYSKTAQFVERAFFFTLHNFAFFGKTRCP